jgi:glycine/serine hydroxymethyltransferase
VACHGSADAREACGVRPASGFAGERSVMPARTEKQRKFMGAELQRKRGGKKTHTDMSEKELEKMASKKPKKG